MKFLFNLIRGIRGLLLPFLVFGSVPNVLAQEMFSIPVPAGALKTQAVKLDISAADGFQSKVFPIDVQNIYGLSITVDFDTPGDRHVGDFGRVVLIDNSTQQEYLVYQESRSYINFIVGGFSVTRICNETCVLPQLVNSFSVRLEARGYALSVSEISYVDTPIPGVDVTELRRQQNAIVIQEFNGQDLGWIAGETSVSNLTYAEKKRLVNLTAESSGEFNLQGFEYYRGGVFEVHMNSSATTKSGGTRQSALVDSFDWRNRHGKSWVTSVRNQGGCGSCAIFAATGATEAVTKLYFNNPLLELDLAEQNVISCSPMSGLVGNGKSNCEEIWFDKEGKKRTGDGWFPSAVLDYFKNTGAMDDVAFPYSGKDIACNLNTPQEKIKVSGMITFGSTGYPKTEDTLKKLLIEKGPVSGGILSLSHAMTLVGFETDPKDGRTIWIFKNSWGDDWGADSQSQRLDYSYGDRWGKYWQEGHANNGYAYIKLDMENVEWTEAIETPIYSEIQPRQISCVDQDLDTYCNWGISKDKPATCLASCKPEKDCDDSDAKKGPFDAKYNCPNTNNEPVPQSPVATFTLSPTAGTAPLIVTLDASASKDPDGTLVSYDWSIGEEEKPIGTGNPFTYTIGTAGQTVITLVVKDNQGLAAKDKKVVTVTPAQQLTLQVNKNGTGEIISLDGQINCGTTCTHNYSDVIPATLRAQISDDLEVKWEGCVTNSTDPKTCEVTMDATKTVTATFSQKPSPQPTVFPLTVNVTGAGKVMCNNVDCLATQNYPANTTVTLTATPASGSTFAGWTGACSGTLVCQVVMTEAKTVSATFQVLPPTVFPLTLNVTGAGKVMCNNVDCLATQNYPANTTVTLIATPASGAIFAGWTGACSGTLVCQVVMTAAKTVTAMFQVLPPLPPVPVVSTCPTDKTVISETCKDYGKQLACNVTIEPRANVSNVVFACNATNQGWIANSTIKTGATVKGGVWTGYITNEGTLADFEFRGASITGGTLSGKIVNKSKVSNWFKNVRLAANTIITGGAVTGTITGDCKAPAKLEKLKVKAGSHLSCVIIGNGVTVQKNVTIENSEQPK